MRWKIREVKNHYRKNMQNQLQQNNISGVWRGLKTISGYKELDFQAVGDQKWLNDLNLFFNRFDQTSNPPQGQSSLQQHPFVNTPCNFSLPHPTSHTTQIAASHHCLHLF